MKWKSSLWIMRVVLSAGDSRAYLFFPSINAPEKEIPVQNCVVCSGTTVASCSAAHWSVFRMGECDPLFSCWVTPSSCHWSHVKAVTELIKQLVIWVLEKGNVQYAVLGAYCLPTAFTGFWIRPIRLPVLLALTCCFQWMLCSGAGCSGEASLSSQGCSTQCVVAV